MHPAMEATSRTTAAGSSCSNSSSPAELLHQLHMLLMGTESDTDVEPLPQQQLQGAGQQQFLEQLIQVGKLQ